MRGGSRAAERICLVFGTLPFLTKESASSPSFQSSQELSSSSSTVLGFLGLILTWAADLSLLSRLSVASISSHSVFQADRVALAAAAADWSSSVDSREGFLSRARRVAVWRLRSGKGVRWGGDAVVGSQVVASAVLGENLHGGEQASEGLEVDAPAVFREGVGGGENVVESGWEKVVARLPAETSIPSVDEADVILLVTKLALLAPLFSPDIVALVERLCTGFLAIVYCRRVQVSRLEP